MITPNAKRRIALTISSAEENGYFHIKTSAAIVDACGKVNSPCYDTATVGGLFLEGFGTSAQGHARYHGDMAGQLYGSEFGYRVHRELVSQNVDKMARTIAIVQRRLDRIYSTRGNASTYAEFVTRVAEAIGATQAAVRRLGADWNSADYWRLMPIGDARHHVDRLESEWRARVSPSAEAAS